jgi:hypothetical protein
MFKEKQMAREQTNYAGQHSIHEEVFSADPYVLGNDTPAGEIGGYMTFIGNAFQPEHWQPMLAIGHTYQIERQPDGSLHH